MNRADLRQTARLKVCFGIPPGNPPRENGLVANPICERTVLMNFPYVVAVNIFTMCFKIFHASSIDIFSYTTDYEPYEEIFYQAHVSFLMIFS